MNIKKVLLTLLIFFTLTQLSGQRYNSYPMYRWPDYFNTNSYVIWRNGIQIDTLVQKLNVMQSIQVETKKEKRKSTLEGQRIMVYDTLGRVIERNNINRYGDWFFSADYSQKNKQITKSKYFYKEVVRNDSNKTTHYYSERYRKNGKTKRQYLTTHTYNYSKWINASYSNKSSKDTTDMLVKAKYYYTNDTGNLLRKELFRKGKLSYTYIYDCDLAEKAKTPKKDSTRVCQNQATDDRGFTYYTRYSYKDSRTYKSVSVLDPKKRLVESYTYIVLEGRELPTYIYLNNKDSIYRKTISYNRNLKSQRLIWTTTSFKNKSGKTARVISQQYYKGKRTASHYYYYKYYRNGLLRSSSFEWINSKGKIENQTTSNYYYSYFNS